MDEMRRALRPVKTRVRHNDGSVTYETRDPSQHTQNELIQFSKLLQDAVSYQLDHVMQQEKWDCGLCCLAMVLGDITSLQQLKSIHLGTVVWTLNMAYILKDFQREAKFFTIERKINANYDTDIFSLQQSAPDRDIFHRALEETKKREENAERNGIVIEQRELTSDELKHALLNGNCAIVLINSLFFGCLDCHPTMFNELTFCVMPVTGNPYRGHYIVLCGYNSQTDVFLFKNPSSDKSVCFVPASTLEQSRKSYGTQQNLLLVKSPEKMKQHS